jgi:3-oxoacyl-[acyl-carrier protein] reductase
LASEGAKVAIFELKEEFCRETVKEIEDAGGEALGLACDITDEEQVEKAVAQVASQLGRVDILVNNAGIVRDNLLFKMTLEDWQAVMDVHLKGSFLCARAAQKYMVQQRYGKIVNISSQSAYGFRGQSNYSAAKAGLQGLTRTMAIELGPFNINVNIVAPGYVITEMTRATAERLGKTHEEEQKRVAELNPLRRVGKPEDIANVIAFLVSEDSSYMTGQTLYVNGGSLRL